MHELRYMMYLIVYDQMNMIFHQAKRVDDDTRFLTESLQKMEIEYPVIPVFKNDLPGDASRINVQISVFAESFIGMRHKDFSGFKL